MSDSPTILNVCVRSPLWKTFDYKLPKSYPIPSAGARVAVPFGRRSMVGVVLAIKKTSSYPLEKLKAIDRVLDDQPVITPTVLRLVTWASDYYHYPLGELLLSVLPMGLREGKPIKVSVKAAAPLAEGVVNPSDIVLNAAQQAAIKTIADVSGFASFLLHGVTGSGKTEVYLQLIAKVLQQGRQALVLVPEIGLTPQTVQRFQSRFNVPIAVLHSRLTQTQRLQAWVQANAGDARIVIGTRSAVFVPLQKPGVIILDEEHDLSFKQQSGIRYSARDLAVMRASLEAVPIVLGSATPSIASLHNVSRGRYRYVSLPTRAGEAKPPVVRLVDLRSQSLLAGLSEAVFAAIDRHLAVKGQVLLFLNRRGYAPVMLCHSCGHSECCPYCDVRLTLHKSTQRLRCHHCDFQMPINRVCPNCQQSDLMPIGQGTERLAQVLGKRYGASRVLRIDRDTTRKKGEMDTLLSKAHAQAADILIGTQMLAKGHHFANLTLVVVVDADSGLMSVDFRALERLGQLLVQVSGRAGREETVGEVLIQTHQPEHPLLQQLIRENYLSFTKSVLAERKATCLPPYSHFALLRAEHQDQTIALATLDRLKQALSGAVSATVQVQGPMASPMEKRAGRYRAQLLLHAQDRQALQQVLRVLRTQPKSKKAAWSLDVDPQELF